MADAELEGLATFLYEMGQLKRSKRTGWWLPGVKDPESVAEHSFRTAIIGHLLAVMEGADPARTALLCLFHDTQETRVGDIPSVGRDYLTTAPNEQITDDQVAAFPAEVGEAVRELVGEYEARTSLEAQVARDADKLECLIQAREYEVQGYANVTPWVRAADTVPKASRGYDAAKKINAASGISPSIPSGCCWPWWSPPPACASTSRSSAGGSRMPSRCCPAPPSPQHEPEPREVHNQALSQHGWQPTPAARMNAANQPSPDAPLPPLDRMRRVCTAS